jgi:hypothetical protein
VIIPGPLYRESDVARFDAIDRALRGSALLQDDAERVAALLAHVEVRAQTPLLTLSRVVDHLPTLGLIQRETAEDFTPIPQVLGMISTIVNARLRRIQLRELRSRPPSDSRALRPTSHR